MILTLNDTFLAVLPGVSLSSVSSTSIALAALFFGGAFTFAFSMHVCPFLLTSGMVFEGNISATYKVLSLLVLKSSDFLDSHLLITYLHYITIVVQSILSGGSCCKVCVVHIGLVIIHHGSLVFKRAPRLCRASGRGLSGVSKLIEFLCGNSCSQPCTCSRPEWM